METLSFRKKIGIALALSLGLSACGNVSGSSPDDKKAEETVDFTVENTYTESGKRITEYKLPNGDKTETLYAHCDGLDLVERTSGKGTNQSSGSPERTEGHPACLDGRLDASDFTPAS